MITVVNNKAYDDAWDRVDAAWAADPTTADAKDAAAALGPLFAFRADLMHQAIRGFGLNAPDLRPETARLAEFNAKVIKFLLTDALSGQDVGVEFTRNGNVFSGGRRYEAAVTKASLSDAEIARSGIFRFDVDHETGGMDIIFMTFDGKPAHLKVAPAFALQAEIVGKTPDASLAVMRARADSVGLGALAQQIIDVSERSGATGSALSRLLSSNARQAAGDVALMKAYLATPHKAADEAANWKNRADDMRTLVESMLRRLSGEPALHRLQGPVLIAVGVGQLLAKVA